MQDFLVAIIIGWILFRLFRPVVFVQWNKSQKHYHNYSPGSPNQTPEGEIKVIIQVKMENMLIMRNYLNNDYFIKQYNVIRKSDICLTILTLASGCCTL